MRNYNLITDSSANPAIMAQGVDTVPLRVRLGNHEYVDDAKLDTAAMLEDLREYKGKSGSACPGVQDWLDAFGNADEVFAATISSGVSGCYNAAAIAANTYMADNSGKKAYVLDSLPTGPELHLLMEKYQELLHEGMSFEDICEALIAVMPTLTVDGITGQGMTWAASGEVSKAPMAIVIRDGADVTP